MEFVLGQVEKPLLNTGNGRTDGNKRLQAHPKACCKPNDNPDNNLMSVHKKVIYSWKRRQTLETFSS